MTRDEAIATVLKFAPENSMASERKWAAQHVDLCEALGMLKFDEPKSLEQKLADLTEYGHRTLTEWRARLDSAGLKIVEK